MRVHEMKTWAELLDEAQRLDRPALMELVRFLNFGGVADKVARLTTELGDLKRAKRRARYAEIKGSQRGAGEAVDEALAAGLATWERYAKEKRPLSGLNRHDLDAVQKWLDVHGR